jgi:hypothetical protein
MQLAVPLGLVALHQLRDLLQVVEQIAGRQLAQTTVVAADLAAPR